MVHFCHYGSPLFLLLLPSALLPLRGSKEMSQFIFQDSGNHPPELSLGNTSTKTRNPCPTSFQVWWWWWSFHCHPNGLGRSMSSQISGMWWPLSKPNSALNCLLSQWQLASIWRWFQWSSSSVVDGRRAAEHSSREAAQIQAPLLPLSPFRFRLSRGRRPPDSSQLRRALSRILVTHSSTRKWAEKWQLTFWTYQRGVGGF